MLRVYSAVKKHPARKPGKREPPQGANLWLSTVPAGMELGLVFQKYFRNNAKFFIIACRITGFSLHIANERRHLT